MKIPKSTKDHYKVIKRKNNNFKKKVYYPGK